MVPSSENLHCVQMTPGADKLWNVLKGNPHTKVTSVTCRSARPAPTIIFSMLRSLLLSRDELTVRVVTRGFKDLDVQLQHFSESDIALAHATKHRFDAIVVDDQLEE